MNGLLKKGWDMTVRHKYVVVLLFLYRLMWGFFLYRFVDAVAAPLLARFPSGHPNPDAAELFLIEARFRLMKTGLADETLWLLGGLFLVRMVLTPLLSSGVYYSFHHSDGKGGTKVLSGMRAAWKPVALLYGLEKAALLLPAFWLLPLAEARLAATPSLADWLIGLAPYAAAWAAGGFVLHLLFQFMQFGAVAREGALKGLTSALRKLGPLIAVSLILFGIGLAVSLTAWAVTLLWSGFAAIALHQGFHFLRSLLVLWTAASQYELWHTANS